MAEIEVEAFRELPIGIASAEQLEYEPDLGNEVEGGGFYARVADAPMGYSLRHLLAKSDISQERISNLYNRFGVWLVPHRVSIIRRSGLAEPTSVGLEVRYRNEGKTCSIVSLFPSFEFIQHGVAEIKCSARMSGTGELSAAPEAEDHASGSGLPLRCGMTLNATLSSGIGIEISARVVTPVISSVGVGSQSCEWRFNKKDEPLFGKDIETWSILVLPKRQSSIRYDIRFYFNARTAFFSTRRESEWTTLECSLEG